MPTNIPYIHPKNAYRFKVTVTEDTLPSFEVPSDWQDRAHKLLPGLSKHTSDAGQIAKGYPVYKGRADLVRSVRFFYAVLTDCVTLPGIDINDSMKAVIKSKMLEQIEACSEGFHNRINGLYGLFFVPKTLSELLQRVRQGILSTIVTVDGDEVHRQNYLKLRANRLGYGVECPNAQDGYRGFGFMSADSVINNGFSQRFQLFDIINKLIEEIRSVLINSFAYLGRLEEGGYAKGDFSKFQNFINALFNTSFNEQALFEFDEDYQVVDLKWHLITKTLWGCIKKDIFVLPDNVLTALTTLFEMPLETPNEATINAALTRLTPLITSANMHKNLCTLLPVLPHKQVIDLFFKRVGTWPKQKTELEYILSFSVLNDKSQDFQVYFSEAFKKERPQDYATLQRRLEVSYSGAHPLSDALIAYQGSVADVISQMRLLCAKDRGALLNEKRSNGQTLFQKILAHNYVGQRRYTRVHHSRQISVHQSLPNIFSLLYDFNQAQLRDFFSDNNYLQTSLDNNRSCLLPMLKLLEKCDANVVFSQLFVEQSKHSAPSLFFSLLNKDDVLSCDKSNSYNARLGNKTIEDLRSSAFVLLKKLPVDFQELLLVAGSGEQFLLNYHALNMSNSQGAELFSCLSPSLNKKFLEELPESFQADDKDRLMAVLKVVSDDSLIEILKKNIYYSPGVFSSKKASSLARFLFFSPNQFADFSILYKKMSQQNKQLLNGLIFIKENTTELGKWLMRMDTRANIAEYQAFSLGLPEKHQKQLVQFALKSNEASWPIILPIMATFSIKQLSSLFDVGVKRVMRSKKRLKDAVLEDSSLHKPFTCLLKALKSDEERSAIVKGLFDEDLSFLSNVLQNNTVNADSFELLKLFPETLIFSMLKHASTHNRLHDERALQYMALLPRLTKSRALQTIENKHRFERDPVKKAALQLAIAKAAEDDNLRNAALASELSQVLLLGLGENGQSMFQRILEQSPSHAYQLVFWLQAFDKGQVGHSFLNHAIIFDEAVGLALSESFNDVLTLIQRVPTQCKLKSLRSLSTGIETKEQLLTFFNAIETLNASAVKYFFERSGASQQNTLIETLSFKKDYRNLIALAMKFVREQRVEKAIAFTDTFDINRCDINRCDMSGAALEKKHFLFEMAWQGSSLQKQQAMIFWQTLNAESTENAFPILEKIKEDLSEDDKALLFNFDRESVHSVLHHFISYGGSMTQSNWLPFIHQLSDEMFYDLLLNEPYGSGNLPLHAHLAMHHEVEFFNVYSWILARKDSPVKERALKEQVSVSKMVLRDLCKGSKPADYSSYVLYCLQRPVLEMVEHVLNAINNDSDATWVELNRFFGSLCETAQGTTYFSQLLLHKVRGGEPLFLNLIRKQPALFERCFSVFGSYAEQDKINLLTQPSRHGSRLYLEVSTNQCFYQRQGFYNLVQLNTITRHIARMPHQYWERLTGGADRFFFDPVHLDQDYLLSPYLLLKTPRDLNRLLSHLGWCAEATFLKVFQELNGNTGPTMQTFLERLRDDVTPENINRLFNIRLSKGSFFATNALMNNPNHRALFMSCLAKLSVANQTAFIDHFFWQALEPMPLDLKQWLELKVQLLNLELVMNDFRARSYDDSAYLKPQQVLETLLGKLNQVYLLALDGNEKEKGKALASLKRLLDDPKTRQEINSHRGVKKILMNVLLAFAGLGVGYLAGCLINLCVTRGEHFFFHPSTNTESIVADIEKKVEGLEGKLPPPVAAF